MTYDSNEIPQEQIVEHELDHIDTEQATESTPSAEFTGDGFVPAEDELAALEDDSDAPVMLDGASSQEMTEYPDLVRGDNVTINQGGAGRVEANTVSVNQGGVGQVQSDALTVSQSGIGMARTHDLTVEAQGFAFGVVADNATVEEGASVFVLVARNTNGEVRPALDWRAALVVFAGLILVLRLLRHGR